VSELKLPEMRQNFIGGLEVFTEEPPHPRGQLPGSTKAVHWFIDDTFWDVYPTSDDIGMTLWNEAEAEAEAVSIVVSGILAILEDVGGASSKDSKYFKHRQAPAVRAAARDALDLLLTNDRAHASGQSEGRV
jgi:hypothetical protein